MDIAIQDTYPDDFAHCYGCGKYNEQGLRIKTFATADGTVTEHEPASQYRGAGDFAYGGIIASLIDCHSTGSAAIFWMQAKDLIIGEEPSPRFVTARLEVDYVAPTPLAVLRLEGSAVEIGDRKVTVATSLLAAGNVTARGQALLVRVT